MTPGIPLTDPLFDFHLGPRHAAKFKLDPKHLGFTLARYSFVARMLAGRGEVLEVGCGDGTGMPIVAAAVRRLVGCDITLPPAIAFEYVYHDMLAAPYKRWDAIYLLDVLEHIDAGDEYDFLRNICRSSRLHAPVIVGMPSLESQAYASPSCSPHVNCKTEEGLRRTLERHFDNVFLFGMNDATLHTGFGPMTHYRLAVCT